MIDAKISGTTHVIQLLWTNFDVQWIWKKNARPWIYVWLTVFENNRKSLIQHCELRLHQEWTKVQCYQKGQFQLKKNGEKCPNFKIQMRHIWVIFKQCVPDFWLIFHSWQISQKSPDIKLEIAAQNPPKKGVGKIRYKKTAFNTGIEM